MAAISLSLSAPVGGLNTRDSLDNMPPQDAIRLDNWVVESSKISVRKGYASHATGVGSGAVESIMNYEGASSRLLAASASTIYDVTGSGSGTSKVAGKSNGRYQTVNFGGYMVLVNGADTPMTFNGSVIANAAYTHASLSIASIKQVASFKGRLFFAAGDQKFYYLPVGAVVSGALSEFDLGQIAERGGTVKAIGTWSRDSAGDGLASVIVFVMSTGELIVYSGDNPGADTWTKVGSFVTAPPIGDRCLVNIGGDLIVITTQGALPVSTLLRGGVVEDVDATNYGKVRQSLLDAAIATSTEYGWSGIRDSLDNSLLINVPVGGSTYDQYRYAITSGAWSKFTNVPAVQFATLGNDIYFGAASGGRVFKMTGTQDNGAAIPIKAKTAFNYFGSRTTQKQITAVRPVIALDGSQAMSVFIDTDFGDRTISATNTTIAGLTAGCLWNAANWNAGIWGGPPTPNDSFISQNAIGRNHSLRLEANVTGQNLSWISIDYVGQSGGIV